MPNPFTLVRPGSGGGGGGGSPDDPTARELQVVGYETINFFHERVHRITNAAWATFATLTYTGGGSYGRGFVEINVGGLTNNVGSGARFSRWYFDYAGGAPTVAVVGSDVASGNGPCAFQLAVSGNNVLLQAKSFDGTNTQLSTLVARIYIPALSGGGSLAVS